MAREVFDELYAVNVNEKTEKKKAGNTELTYLSWAWAWAEVKRRYPDAHYEIQKFNGLPYVFDPRTGYMVYTQVTIDGITHEMWLPVMDGANKAMKAEPYQYITGFGQYQKTKTCEAATMFDINKTIMRCLVKNLAMFGLGLYIYAGEDLPEPDEEETQVQKPQTPKPSRQKSPVTPERQRYDGTPMLDQRAPEKAPETPWDPNAQIKPAEVTILRSAIQKYAIDEAWICQKVGCEKLETMTALQYGNCMRDWVKIKAEAPKKEAEA